MWRRIASATKPLCTLLVALSVLYLRNGAVCAFAFGGQHAYCQPSRWLTDNCRRDAGAIVNVVVSKAAKFVFQEGRPDGSTRHDGGMPSSHAQGLAFLASYVGPLTAYSRAFLTSRTRHCRANALSTCPSYAVYGVMHLGWSRAVTAAAGVVIAAVAASMATARVVVRLHTWPQVAVGAAFGLLVAAMWMAAPAPYVQRHADAAIERMGPSTVSSGLCAVIVVGVAVSSLVRWESITGAPPKQHRA